MNNQPNSRRQYVPSNVLKFKYRKLHPDYRLVVYQEYKPIDRIGYRLVSQNCAEEDFVPIRIEKIAPEKEFTRKHLDERSLSFFVNEDACNQQAVNSYRRMKDKKGVEDAEIWKSKHTHIAEVPLTPNDGFMEVMPIGFHFNFAPFETYIIKTTKMVEVDYSIDETYYLQIDDVSAYVMLYVRDDNSCYLRVQNENPTHIPYRVKVVPRDVIRYMRRRITLKKLCKNGGLPIQSTLGMYAYCNSSDIYGKEHIVDKLYSLISQSDALKDKLFHYFFFRRPSL